MKFNIDVMASIAIYGILTHKDTCSVVFPHAFGAKRGAVKTCRDLTEEHGGRRSLGRRRWQRRIQRHRGEFDPTTPPADRGTVEDMMYPVTLRRVSESAAKLLLTHTVKTLRLSVPGSQ